MSFGENESCMDPAILEAQHDAFVTATQQDMTLIASSGDQGAAQPTCDGNSWVKAASTPAVDPLVMAVGGTELQASGYCLASLGCNPSTNPSPGTYQGEIAWNEGPPYGDFQSSFSSSLSTGGGFSVLFDEPPYQQATIHGGKQRAVPDVAYNAAVLHGVLTYLNIPGVPAGFYRFGGTSAGSPQWSAVTVIANQKARGRLGFLNSAIYKMSKQADPAPLHDITSGSNSVVEPDSLNNPVTVIGFAAHVGWDATTGDGTPIGRSLVDQLVENVSPGDRSDAIATTHSHASPPAIESGRMGPH
jgi:subtilase family serine protease